MLNEYDCNDQPIIISLSICYTNVIVMINQSQYHYISYTNVIVMMNQSQYHYLYATQM